MNINGLSLSTNLQAGDVIPQWPEHISENNGTLIFSEVKSSDKGTYVCVASSIQGLIKATIHVDVVGKQVNFTLKFMHAVN